MRRGVVVLFSCILFLMEAAYGQSSCSSPANAIVAENCNVGTTAWDVGGLGDLTIQGFATDISVNVGQTISFKVSTPASSYHIDIYRMGYYGGSGGRYLTTVYPTAQLPQAQPACLTDPTTRLYDCGNWGTSASWTVPANAVSGIYIAAPVRDDTGGASQIIFVVRNDASHSAILFQTSDPTWQAYNGYGGYSVYGPSDTWDLNNRAYKVSYNRPSDTRTFDNESSTWVFGEEYPMVRWLESNGYDVSYFTGVDAERNGNLIKNHQLFMDVGHDEYWSGPQRANVEAARDAGVNLAFFSGNEVFWKTRWENSIDGSNTPFRTMVVYKETLGPNSVPSATAAVDPNDPPTWTGTWRDPAKSPPADGGRAENSLTGTIFMVNGVGPDNPGTLSIQVPSDYSQMRFWRNTTIENLAAGKTATLPAGTLGYEWDEDLDNGSRPSGTFDLSSTTVNLTTDLLLDAGGKYGAGSATHHMTEYRAPSGALVFGAGTIQWAWGLDQDHDDAVQGSNLPADPDMQQATANLFADMGVLPATLQPGLVMPSRSTDTTPPISTITSPRSGAVVQYGIPVTVTGTAIDTGGGVVSAVEVSGDGGQTWHRATGRASWSYAWTPVTAGSVTVLSRAVDDSANLEILSPGVDVTVPAPPIFADAAVSTDGTSASTTIQSPSFATTVNNELLLAFITADYVSGANTTVTNVTGGGLTWTLVVRSNGQSGDSEIWRALASSPVGAATVTATLSQSVVSSITVRSFEGVNTSGTNGSGAIGATASANAKTGAPSISLTTTQNESWVYGVGNDFDSATPRVPDSGQLLVHQDLTAAGDTYWVQMRSGPTYSAGTVASIDDTSPTADRWNLAAVEILPSASGTLSISGSISPTAAGAGASVLLTGTVTATVAANASGNFTFAGLPNGSYVVTPEQAGYVFTPSSTSITLSGTSATGVTFTGAQAFSISGTVSPATSGVLVSLSGTSSATTTTNSSGNYSFPSELNGSYAVTPSEAGFSFTPISQSVTVNGSNMSGINFTAAATSFSVSGSLSTLGANATVTLSGAASKTIAADASGNYSFATLANGSYTITPTKSGYTFTPVSQNVSVSGANVSAVNFTAQALATASVASDAKVSTDGTSASSTIASPSLTTSSGNELLLAFISTDYLSGTNTSITGVTGGGLNWTLVVRTNAQKGTAEVWKAFATAPLSNVTVTASLSQSVVSSITVMSFSGVDPTGTGGAGAIGATASASAATGAPTATLVTTRNNSWVFGVGDDYTNASARTAGANQTIVHQDLASSGDTYWVQAQNSPTPASGTRVTINDTAPTKDSYNLSLVEILPSLGASSISGSVSPAASGLTVNLSGPVSESTVTGASGAYSFTALPNGTYTVTPSSGATTFTPSSQSVTVTGNSLTGVNFAMQVLSVSPATIPFSATIGGSNPSATTVDVTDTGSGTLSFTAGSDSSWLTASPTSSTTPQTLQIAASITGLTAGTHTGHITVTSTGAQGSPAVVTVTLTVNSGTFLISGNVSTNGANATVALSGSASGTTAADSSGNYTFAGLANGSYTITPTKSGYTFSPTSQQATVNNANVSGVNFTATQNVSSGLAIDAKVSKDSTTAATTIASSAFSTTAGNELLLAFISADYLSGTNTTVSNIASTGLTWTLVLRTNTQRGTAEIWRAFASSKLTNVTVTATLSQKVLTSMTVMSFTGVDTTGTNGAGAIGNTGSANAKPGAPSASIVTTRNSSWVFGVGTDWDSAVARTPGTNQTVVHQVLTSAGDTYWVQMQSSPTPLSGTIVTINDTAPVTDRYNLSVVEIRTP